MKTPHESINFACSKSEIAEARLAELVRGGHIRVCGGVGTPGNRVANQQCDAFVCVANYMQLNFFCQENSTDLYKGRRSANAEKLYLCDTKRYSCTGELVGGSMRYPSFRNLAGRFSKLLALPGHHERCSARFAGSAGRASAGVQYPRNCFSRRSI